MGELFGSEENSTGEMRLARRSVMNARNKWGMRLPPEKWIPKSASGPLLATASGPLTDR